MIRISKKETGYSLLELMYVVSIISLLLALLIPQLILQKARMTELQAQRRLRSIGSVMTDFSLSDPSRNYADFQDLKDSDLINKDLTPGSIILDYSLIFNTTNVVPGSPALYTIIAIPRPERANGQLSTFAITEDNVIRIYRPGPGISLNDPQTWPPIL